MCAVGLKPARGADFHLKTAGISSRGTPLVSGRKKSTKRLMMTTHPAKKRKMPNCIAQSMDRKDCKEQETLISSIPYKARYDDTSLLYPYTDLRAG
jgi:hypothetical protein